MVSSTGERRERLRLCGLGLRQLLYPIVLVRAQRRLCWSKQLSFSTGFVFSNRLFDITHTPAPPSRWDTRAQIV